MPYTPALTRALTTVDEDAFVRRPDGNLVTQSSAQRIIADMINRLDLQPGMTVLEIGTGSGYSTALLADIVGAEGLVVSLDVVAELVTRANSLLAAHHYTKATVIRTDGIQGAPEHGPFDRIIAWTTAPSVPTAWITQSCLSGVIVAPLTLASISKSGVGTRIELADDATPYIDQVFPAGFVEMHGQELDQWLVPPYGIDVLRHDLEQRPWWLSAEWMRSPEQYLNGQHILNTLVADHKEIPGPLQPDESAEGFRAWLLATRPSGLTTAACGDPLWRIGHTHPTGVAVTDVRTATSMFTAGDRDAPDALNRWADQWRDAGRPGLADLNLGLVPFGDGWALRAEPRK